MLNLCSAANNFNKMLCYMTTWLFFAQPGQDKAGSFFGVALSIQREVNRQ